MQMDSLSKEDSRETEMVVGIEEKYRKKEITLSFRCF